MLSILALLLLCASMCSCFMVPQTTRTYRHRHVLSATKTTLTEETMWSLRLLLKSVPTEQGKKIDQMFVIKARFIEEEGYEPPQGTIEQQMEGDGTTLRIAKSRWVLSEDPNDRKDSLWIWGLLKEPMYPFMLLQLETSKFELPGEGGDAILPLKLFAQINHARDKEKGVILSPAELKVREMETVKADPIGAAMVDLYEEVSVGQLTFKAL